MVGMPGKEDRKYKTAVTSTDTFFVPVGKVVSGSY
jgi:hypothetical protein